LSVRQESVTAQMMATAAARHLPRPVEVRDQQLLLRMRC
jgi:hypothetical protein